MRKIRAFVIILAFLLLSAFATSLSGVKAQSVTWTVAGTGNADFHNIQTAINSVSPGDIILVKNGTYLETLTVDKSVTLIGENPLATFIVGITSVGAISSYSK